MTKESDFTTDIDKYIHDRHVKHDRLIVCGVNYAELASEAKNNAIEFPNAMTNANMIYFRELKLGLEQGRDFTQVRINALKTIGRVK